MSSEGPTIEIRKCETCGRMLPVRQPGEERKDKRLLSDRIYPSYVEQDDSNCGSCLENSYDEFFRHVMRKDG
jgi:hypothetical protein